MVRDARISPRLCVSSIPSRARCGGSSRVGSGWFGRFSGACVPSGVGSGGRRGVTRGFAVFWGCHPAMSRTWWWDFAGPPGRYFGQRRRRLPGESGKCRSSPAGSVQACASIRRPSHSMVVEWPLDPELLETTGDFPEALKSLLPIGLGPVLVWAGLAMGGDTRELVRGAGLCSVIEFDMPRIWRCVWGRSRHLKPNGVLGLQVGWMC